MKAGFFASLSLVAGVLSAPAAHEHGAKHHHHHAQKREADYVIKYETITVDSQGKPLGTMVDAVTIHETVTTSVVPVVAASPSPLKDAGNVFAAVKAAISETTTTPLSAVPTPQVQISISTTPIAIPATTPTTTVKPAAPTKASSGGGTSGLALQAGTVANPLAPGVAPSTPFADGTIDCASFPGTYEGVLDLSYLGMGGYAGIQLGNSAPNTCVEGALCSYVCQPGMLKSQWPSAQPADGQSRGGLLCKNGKLYLSDSSKPFLCEWGQQSAFVKSSLGQGVAICQTDYPGTENMVLPTWVAPGAQAPLAVVMEDSYYVWQGKKTSSQFYVNNAGISQQDGCQWGSTSNGFGNYAPLNFGAGYTGGISWLSMFPNPNAISKLNFSVRFEAAAGSTMNGDCYYENGVFGGSSATANGCTVACKGTCYYNFY